MNQAHSQQPPSGSEKQPVDQAQSFDGHISGDGNQVYMNQAAGDINIFNNKNEVDNGVKRYFEGAREFIGRKYARYREINEKDREILDKIFCRTKEDFQTTSLSKEQADAINSDILYEFEKEYKQIEKYIEESKEKLKEYFNLSDRPEISREMEDILHDQKQACGLKIEAAESIPLVSMGNVFFDEYALKRAEYDLKYAEACFKKARDYQEGREQGVDPRIYIHLGSIEVERKQYAKAYRSYKKAKTLMKKKVLFSGSEISLFSDSEINSIQSTIENIEKMIPFPRLSRLIRKLQAREQS
ncbi:MAG: hypothetical protein AAF959_22950 [Cyanobacteria bacterium P01_D01_bin.56]